MKSQSILEELEADEPTDEASNDTRGSAPPPNEDSPFRLVNAIDTRAVLDFLAHPYEGKFCDCPGCGEPKALITDAGVKCLHNRCSDVGPPRHPGLRSNIDLVCCVRQVKPKEALQILADRFNIDLPKRQKRRRAKPVVIDAKPGTARHESLWYTPNTAFILQALADTGLVYKRCLELVRIVRGEAPRKVRDAELVQRLLPVESENVLTFIGNRYPDMQSGQRSREANTVLASKEWPQLIPIVGLTDLPVVRPDGAVAARQGYDPDTGYYLAGHDWPGLGEGDPDGALTALEEVFCDFPFGRDEQRSALIGLLLTIVSKPSYDAPTPLWLIEAARVSSGKTLACDAVALITSGQRVPKREAPTNRDEWPKALMALLECAYPFAQIDNITGELRTDTLDVIGTSTVYAGRRLGSNDAAANREVPIATVFALTGNNAKVSRDLGERLVRCRIVRDLEEPSGGWRHAPLLGWIESERERLLRAVYTVVCSYRRLTAAERAGIESQLRPMKTGVYDTWTGWVRGPLMWLRGHDIAPSKEDKAELSERDAAIEQLIPALGEIFGAREFNAKDCLSDNEARELLKETLPPPRRGDFDARHVGTYLGRLVDNVVDGVKLVRKYRKRRSFFQATRI